MLRILKRQIDVYVAAELGMVGGVLILFSLLMFISCRLGFWGEACKQIWNKLSHINPSGSPSGFNATTPTTSLIQSLSMGESLQASSMDISSSPSAYVSATELPQLYRGFPHRLPHPNSYQSGSLSISGSGTSNAIFSADNIRMYSPRGESVPEIPAEYWSQDIQDGVVDFDFPPSPIDR